MRAIRQPMRTAESSHSSAPEKHARAARRVLFIAPQSLAMTGGIETATNRLIDGLAGRGWQVSWLVARIVAWNEAVVENAEGQAVDLPAFLQDRRIDVVVNQHGFECAFTILYKRLGCAVPLINVFHSTPSGGGVNFNAPVWFRALREQGWKALGQPRLIFYPPIYWLRMRKPLQYGRRMRINHDGSDRFVMLSERFYPEFQRRSGVADLAKVRAIPNPLRYAWAEPAAGPRERIFLVVSRLSEAEKRLSRVLRLWSELDSGRAEGWRLVIVGDGRDRAAYEQMVQDLKLENVVFAGEMADPQPYYERASVLLLTSAYEGWAMVLTEALQHGVVPVALDTFATVGEIISHEETGLIVPANQPAALAVAARQLMDDEPLRLRLARNGPASVRHFELSRIAERWETLLEEVIAEA